MSAQPQAPTQPAADQAGLIEAMAKENVKPLWSLYKTLNTREPQYYEPMIWPWEAMSKLVDRSAREVGMAEAERRALLFAHPAFTGTVFTTPTLSGALAGARAWRVGACASPYAGGAAAGDDRRGS